MKRTFFVGATLVDGINPPQERMTIVVEGTRIAAVRSIDTAPAFETNDQIFDAAGLTLMPGMFHCHFHPAMDNIKSYSELDMKYPSEYLTLIAAKNGQLMLQSGFTSVIGAGSPANIDIVLKHAINSGLIPGPRFTACGRHLCTTGESLDFHPSFWKSALVGFGHACDGPEEFRKAIRTEIKDGVDIVKVHVTGGHGSNYPIEITPITFEELLAASDAAHERGKKIRAHASNKRGILASVRAAVDLVDHVDLLDDECIEAFLKGGQAITSGANNLGRYIEVVAAARREGKSKSIVTNPITSPFHSESASNLEVAQVSMEHYRAFLPKAVKAGVKLLLGDDTGGISPHGMYADELVSYVKDVGISAQDVITMATRMPALFLQRDDLGVIADGKTADLLLVKGNPVENIAVLQQRSNLAVIMKDGAFVDCQLTARGVQNPQPVSRLTGTLNLA